MYLTICVLNRAEQVQWPSRCLVPGEWKSTVSISHRYVRRGAAASWLAEAEDDSIISHAIGRCRYVLL